MIRRLLILSIILMVLSFLAGCRKDTPVVVGYAAPMTGESAKMGEDMTKGITLAVEEWNAKGGIAGKKIIAVPFDDRSDPKEAVSVAQRAIAQGVRGVIGHYNSSCTIPSSELTNEAGIVMITPASTNPKVTSRGLKLIFRTCGRDDQQCIVLTTAITDTANAKVAILHDKTTYGQGLAEEFQKNLSPSVQVVLFDAIQRGDIDFSAILTRVRSVSPDYVMYGGLYPEAGLLVKQMRYLGISAIFVSGNGAFDSEFIRIGGDAAEGALVTYAPPAEQLTAGKDFVAKVTARYGEFSPSTMYTYDAVNILLGAIAQNPTAEGKELAEIIRTSVWQCASGSVEYDSNGDRKNAPFVIWTVKNGKFVVK